MRFGHRVLALWVARAWSAPLSLLTSASSCDGNEDCPDGEDEAVCQTLPCGDGIGTYLESAQCDGKTDCDDAHRGSSSDGEQAAAQSATTAVAKGWRRSAYTLVIYSRGTHTASRRHRNACGDRALARCWPIAGRCRQRQRSQRRSPRPVDGRVRRQVLAPPQFDPRSVRRRSRRRTKARRTTAPRVGGDRRPRVNGALGWPKGQGRLGNCSM